MTTLSHPHTAGAPHAPHLRSTNADHSAIAPSEIAVGVIIGRASEYFDFFVFGIAAVMVFPAVFFPMETPLAGALWAFAVFALAFIARPFGTVAFMAVQRRFGRGAKLSGALFLLGVCTAGMAFLPGYATLGPAAIVVLALLRIGQGVAVGGSWDGLPSLLALNAPAHRRGWYAMVPQLGAPIGFIVASGLFLYLYASLSHADFLEWGWRYPFYVAFAINVVALFARLRIVMTPEYERLMEQRHLLPAPVAELVRDRAGNLLIGAFAALASYALFHLVTVFPLSWISLHAGQPVTEVLGVQIAGAAIAIPCIVASGLLADRIGRRSTLGVLAGLIGVFALFAPALLESGRWGQDLFILVGFALLGLSYGQAAGAVSANFEAHYRYTGAALTSDLAWLLGAAFAPLVVLGLSSWLGLVAVSGYLLSGVACTLVALHINRARESRG